MIHIMVADDHPLVRIGIADVIKRQTTDMTVIGEASDARELMALIREMTVDIVVLDITMPGRNGLDVLKELKNTDPKLPVLMLSMHPEERFGIRSLKMGASGYLNKRDICTKLITAVRRIVLEKKRYISPDMADELAMWVDPSREKPLHHRLSDREYQVVCLIGSGKNIESIARELSISIPAVHTIRRRIKEKLQLDSNVGFTRYVLQQNLVD